MARRVFHHHRRIPIGQGRRHVRDAGGCPVDRRAGAQDRQCFHGIILGVGEDGRRDGNGGLVRPGLWRVARGEDLHSTRSSISLLIERPHIEHLVGDLDRIHVQAGAEHASRGCSCNVNEVTHRRIRARCRGRPSTGRGVVAGRVQLSPSAATTSNPIRSHAGPRTLPFQSYPPCRRERPSRCLRTALPARKGPVRRARSRRRWPPCPVRRERLSRRRRHRSARDG